MAGKKSIRKIIWALDPLEDSDKSRNAVGSLLLQLSKKERTRVEPVYVFSPHGFKLTEEFTPAWFKRYSPGIKKEMDLALKEFGFKDLGRTQVIWERRSSLRAVVATLLNHAAKSEADLIVTSTHGRAGFERLVMGSFTETLLLHSKLPVLVVHPGWKPAKIDRILFPTDLSAGSKKTLQQVIQLANTLGAELVIHHAMPKIVAPLVQSGVLLLGGGWVPFPEYFAAREQEASRTLAEWEGIARKEGARVSSILDRSSISVTESVRIQTAKTKSTLIAIEAKSGPARSALLGSISREIIRNATCPVWVMRKS